MAGYLQLVLVFLAALYFSTVASTPRPVETVSDWKTESRLSEKYIERTRAAIKQDVHRLKLRAQDVLRGEKPASELYYDIQECSFEIRAELKVLVLSANRYMEQLRIQGSMTREEVYGLQKDLYRITAPHIERMKASEQQVELKLNMKDLTARDLQDGVKAIADACGELKETLLDEFDAGIAQVLKKLSSVFDE
ncbi:hypothetical protein HDE_11206 [Halotydeus destructor]|nr:hypothetical protein HDE_11206 [Halotydeus destructor]